MSPSHRAAPIDRRVLGIYLNDHLAGATGGTALARRARAGAVAADLIGALDEVAPEVAEDREALLGIMRALGVPVRTYKMAGGRLAELLGRLKPNGRLRERSPLSDLIELEGLVAGISAKESLWRNLRAITDLPGSMPVQLDGLINRAASQRARLEAARDQVAREAFGPRGGTASPPTPTHVTG